MGPRMCRLPAGFHFCSGRQSHCHLFDAHTFMHQHSVVQWHFKRTSSHCTSKVTSLWRQDLNSLFRHTVTPQIHHRTLPKDAQVEFRSQSSSKVTLKSDKIFFFYAGWLQTPDPPASPSWVCNKYAPAHPATWLILNTQFQNLTPPHIHNTSIKH